MLPVFSLLLASVGYAQDVPSSFESEQRALIFHDEYPAFDVLGYDEWVPYQGAAIALHVFVTPEGGVVTDMQATSDLEWPQAMRHELRGVPGTGFLGIDTSVAFGIDLDYDVFGLFSDSIPLWGDGYLLEGQTGFDPLLLDSPEDPMAEVSLSDPSVVPPIVIAYDLIPLVLGLEASIDVYPQITSTLSANRIETEVGDRTHVVTQQGQYSQIDVPEEDPGLVELATTYFADMTAYFDVVIEPYVAITWLVVFETEVLEIPIPITLVETNEVRAFPTETYTHRLPAAYTDFTDFDFGTVPPGDTVDIQVSLANQGLADLEGWVAIEGNVAFDVFPDYLYATPDNADGFTISFQPEALGPAQGTVRIFTNDPGNPEIVLSLTGMGGELDMPGEIIEGGDEYSTAFRTCGCVASGVGGWGSGWLALLVVGLRRRSRTA